MTRHSSKRSEDKKTVSMDMSHWLLQLEAETGNVAPISEPVARQMLKEMRERESKMLL